MTFLYHLFLFILIYVKFKGFMWFGSFLCLLLRIFLQSPFIFLFNTSLYVICFQYHFIDFHTSVEFLVKFSFTEFIPDDIISLDFPLVSYAGSSSILKSVVFSINKSWSLITVNPFLNAVLSLVPKVMNN